MAKRETLSTLSVTFPVNTSGFVRVNKKKPCRICGKNDWCSYTGDEAMAFCMRESSGSIKQAANGAFIHIIGGGTPTTPLRGVAITSKPKKRPFVASQEMRNLVYEYLLMVCLSLNEDHQVHLIEERGFDGEALETNLYASVPTRSQRESIEQQLADKFGDRLRGVPGFYIDEITGGWRFRFPRDGFLIPALDEYGLISALMVRRDGRMTPKYYWISTPPDIYEGGASSGAPLHYSYPNITDDDYVIITEGILKADRISEFLECSCIGIAGLHSYPDNFDEEIKRIFPQVKFIEIAFDADFRTNPHVLAGLHKLVKKLQPISEVVVLTWDIKDGKGFDDFLFNRRGGKS